jgi:hypothetical protein
MGPRGWAARPWTPEDDRMLDELGGIDFGPMLGDGERFANLRGATEEMCSGAELIRNRLSEAWSGPAAEAAMARLDMLGKGAAGFRDTLNQFAAALDAARSAVRDTIVTIQTAIADRIKPFDVPEGVDFRRQQIDRIDAAMSARPRCWPHRPNPNRRTRGSSANARARPIPMAPRPAITPGHSCSGASGLRPAANRC